MSAKRILAVMILSIVTVSIFLYFIAGIELSILGIIIAVVGLGIAYAIPRFLFAVDAGDFFKKLFRTIGRVLFKSIFTVIALSLVLTALLYYSIYELDFHLLYASNVFFIIGIMFFFPGVIIATNATNVFNGMGYLTKKIFVKVKKQDHNFKSFGEYMEFKTINEADQHIHRAGFFIVSIGAIYIIASLVIGFTI